MTFVHFELVFVFVGCSLRTILCFCELFTSNYSLFLWDNVGAAKPRTMLLLAI